MPREAIWLLDHGGFVILADAATYGDPNPGGTADFVRDTRLTNSLIVCSRSAPPPAVPDACVLLVQ